MTRHPTSIALALFSLAAAAAAVAACRDDGPTTTSLTADHSLHGPAHVRSTPNIQAQVASLRALTAPFHQIEAAAAAGWNTPIPGCFSSADGGMGFHFGNADLIDGAVDVLEPELLVYEPQKNGRMRLVAVEYIVPFDQWTASEPPMLFGQSFHRNEGFGLWVLHVWHFRHNPAGMFSDWNSTVSCEHAAS